MQDLHVSYGPVAAVRGVSFEVADGGVLALLGPNGAGKTSVLEALAGRANASGSIRWDAHELIDLNTVQRALRGVSLVPQERGLFRELTVRENLLLNVRMPGRRKRHQAVDTILEAFPLLGERASIRAGFMSGGEQQLLAVARALIAKPEVLLLDEPSFGLAPKLRVDVVVDVVRECRSRGLTVVLAEQFIDVALEMSDYVVVMYSGEVALESPSESVDRSEVAAVYLEGVPNGLALEPHPESLGDADG